MHGMFQHQLNRNKAPEITIIAGVCWIINKLNLDLNRLCSKVH